MQVKKTVLGDGVGKIYFLAEDNGLPVMCVYRYALFMKINDYSINTIYSYMKNLKIYFEWLGKHGLTYKTAIERNGKSEALSTFSNFKLYIKYPKCECGHVPPEGYVQERAVSTINFIIGTVLSFYDFLARDDDFKELDSYRKVRSNSLFGGFVNKLTKENETAYKSIFIEREPKKKIRYITRSQYNELWDAARNQRDRIIIGLMFEGGLRVSEVVGLHIEDMRDIRQNKVYIKLRKDDNNPDAAVKYHSEGEVFVSDKLKDEILNYLTYTLFDIKTNYFIINLYCKENKFQPMRRSTIQNMVASLGKKVGIENLHPHMLRHGIAVDMREKECPIADIQDKLRHQSIRTTEDVYAEVSDVARRKAMEKYSKMADIDFTPEDNKDILSDLAEFFIKTGEQ